MASTTTSLNNHNFGGIRRKDSMFSEDKITCSDCQNVELYYTELNSAVGIRTAKGNTSLPLKVVTTVDNEEVLSDLQEGETIVGVFETVQLTNTYYIIYTEYTDSVTSSNSEGRLYKLNLSNGNLERFDLGEVNSSPRKLSVTGKCQGTDFQQGMIIDGFCFSNGVDIVFIYSNTEKPSSPLVVAGNEPNTFGTGDKLAVNLTDNINRTVKGLGVVNLFNRLWIFDDNVLWFSRSNAIATFVNLDNSTPPQPDNSSTEVTRAGYIEFSKDITAIHEYLGSLAVFHKDSSALVTETGQEAPLFKASDESPGGCAAYDALVFHGTDLFFYDDTKKGIFSFQQVVNGDKTLSDNIAYDIQDELMAISNNYLHKIRALSVVTSDRNEIWFLTPIESTYTVKEYNELTEQYEDVTKPASIILIYDYIRGEWVKRKCQKINCISIIDYNLYSAGDKLYQEYMTNTFDGDYIKNYYQCTVMNLGTDNTLKITKFPPRLTIDASYQNHFFVKYVKNYNITKKPKIKELFSKSFGNIMTWNSGDKYNDNKIFKPGAISGIIKMPSATYKALEITLYTTDKDQAFTIKALEFSRIKVKQI
jgi:hypothetical protein